MKSVEPARAPCERVERNLLIDCLRKIRQSDQRTDQLGLPRRTTCSTACRGYIFPPKLKATAK